ncbi:hypothetical protein D3C85_1629090 [compost metagenome]
MITWAWSPIKFQADMGLLLTFMFVWNMLGALILIPALSYFLLPDKRSGAVPKASSDLSGGARPDGTAEKQRPAA